MNDEQSCSRCRKFVIPLVCADESGCRLCKTCLKELLALIGQMTGERRFVGVRYYPVQPSWGDTLAVNLPITEMVYEGDPGWEEVERRTIEAKRHAELGPAAMRRAERELKEQEKQ